MMIGIISDTHGLLRPEACERLAGVDHIIHAGDIGAPEILEQLKALAPVSAVRGNNDSGRWARSVPVKVNLELEGVTIHVVHDLGELDARTTARVVISGHSHKPVIRENDGVLYVNPGSAGPRRFKLPIAVGELTIDGNVVSARIVRLDGDVAARANG